MVMKYKKRYTNVYGLDLSELNLMVNTYIAAGCVPVGGIFVLRNGEKLHYYQTLFVEDENNGALGEFEI